MLDTLAAAATSAAAEQPTWLGWLPIVGMIVIFWFLILRPQMRQQKEHATKIAAIKKGDDVVTAGGLIGRVTKVEDHYVHIELAKGMVVKAVKSTIGDIVPPAGAKPAND